jgi:glyoxylase-like metal-dependent hydrolase (beta-lactamase superfamily II)
MKQAVVFLALVACSNHKPKEGAATASGSSTATGSAATGSAATGSAATGSAATGSAAADDAGQIHPFKIGALDAVALKDGGFEPKNDGKVFGVGHTPEEISAVLTKAGAPGDHFELSIQPLLVKDGAHVLLFDTGLGTVDPSHPGRMLKSLAMTDVAPAAITDIFISHAHGDHVGGLVDKAGALTFPNAAIHMSAPEWQSMQANTEDAAMVKAITPKVVPFQPGAKLLPEVTAVATPGHTPGHSSYDISSNGDHLFYLGDVAHSSVLSVQRPTWTVQFDHDHAAAEAMRKKTLTKLAADKMHVYAVHFPFPGLGHIVGQGDDLSWQRD